MVEVEIVGVVAEWILNFASNLGKANDNVGGDLESE